MMDEIKMKTSKVVVATVAGVAGVVSLGGHAVNADTQTTDTTKATTQAAVTPEQQAQADVDTAKANEQQASQTASDAQSKADQAKQNVDSAQADADKAKQEQDAAQKAADAAKENADKATPEAIAAEQQKQQQLEQEEKAKQSAVTDQQSTVDQATKDVADAQAQKDAADKAVSEQQQTVDDKQSTVNEAQAAADGSDATQAQADLEAAQKVTSDQNTVNQAQATVTNAQTAASTADADQAKTQFQLDDVNDQINSVNTIDVPSDYVQALKDYFSGKSMTTEQLALIDQLAKQAKGQQYKSSKADQQIAINSAADITPEIQLQLTQFVASLLNPLRQQLGNTPYTISQGALDFAQQIANNYQTWAKHDVATITEEAGLFGLDDGGNYYEDLGSGYIDRSTKNDWENTLDGIKKDIYNTIIDMLFNDAVSAYGHAGSVLGYRKSLNDNQIYFGVSIDKNGQDYFIGVGSSYIEAPSKFNTTTTYDVPVVDVVALKSQAQALSSELAQKTAVSTAANQSLTDAQAAFATAQATLSTSEQALAAAKATTTNAEAALSQATEKAAQAATQVATDTQAVAAAQAKVDALNADQQTKLAALASAKADLEPV